MSLQALAGDRALLLADLVAGRRQAVGWGVGGLFPYILSGLPFTLQAVIERCCLEETAGPLGLPLLPLDGLRRFDPNRTVVVVLADMARFGAEIAEAAMRFGPFPVIAPPMPADRCCSPKAVQGGRDRVSALLQWRLRGLRPPAPLPVWTEAGNGRRVDLVINSLGPGGAERQLCLLAGGLRSLGWQVRVLPLDGHAIHPLYARMLAEAGVPCVPLPTARAFWGDWSAQPEGWRLAWGDSRRARALASVLQPAGVHALAMLERFWRDEPPDLAVAYLDDANLLTALAARMAGVPRVLMAGRSVRSDHFPEMLHRCATVDDLPRLYRAVLQWPCVTLVNNSDMGARSYEEWLGLPSGRVATIANGIAPSVQRSPAELRQRLGIADAQPLVVGVLRLTEEKCPLLFVDVVAEVIRSLPRTQALLVGDGPLRGAVMRRITELGLDGKLSLLGVREDVLDLMAVSDLLLNVSRVEGQPNVVLEAQGVGRPVVATRAGGTLDCLSPALHPWSRAIGDRDGLAAACLSLLRDRELAGRLGEEGRAYVHDRFSVRGLAVRTLAALGIPAADMDSMGYRTA